jgi:hypothetical protein
MGAGLSGQAPDEFGGGVVPAHEVRVVRPRRKRVVLFVGASGLALVGLGLLAWGVYRRVDPLSYGTYWVPSPGMEPKS